MLPLRCSRPSISFSKSTSFWPSTIARRRSSGCVALISMRFIAVSFRAARCIGAMRRRTASRSRALRRATESMQEKRDRNPWLESPWTAWCGPQRAVQTGSVGACVSAKCWRVARRLPEALHREQRPCGDTGCGGVAPRASVRHASGQTGTTCAVSVAGRGCKAGLKPSCTGIFRVPLKAGFLLRVSCADCPRPPGHLGTAAHLRAGLALHHLRHAPTRGACGLTFEPASAPGKLRQIKHLRNDRGPAHYRGQRPVGGAARVAGAGPRRIARP